MDPNAKTREILLEHLKNWDISWNNYIGYKSGGNLRIKSNAEYFSIYNFNDHLLNVYSGDIDGLYQIIEEKIKRANQASDEENQNRFCEAYAEGSGSVVKGIVASILAWIILITIIFLIVYFCKG